MDYELTLHELRRLEAERKLREIPERILETAWVRDAQIEAVIDAVLAVTYADDAAGYAHARHVGEWSARIAMTLPFGPDVIFARRVGVLADVDPRALERIAELAHLARYVAEFQRCSIEHPKHVRTISLIVETAREFDLSISSDEGVSAATILRRMRAEADESALPMVDALANALRLASNAA
jgi:hypothetical protein